MRKFPPKTHGTVPALTNKPFKMKPLVNKSSETSILVADGNRVQKGNIDTRHWKNTLRDQMPFHFECVRCFIQLFVWQFFMWCSVEYFKFLYTSCTFESYTRYQFRRDTMSSCCGTVYMRISHHYNHSWNCERKNKECNAFEFGYVCMIIFCIHCIIFGKMA